MNWLLGAITAFTFLCVCVWLSEIDQTATQHMTWQRLSTWGRCTGNKRKCRGGRLSRQMKRRKELIVSGGGGVNNRVISIYLLEPHSSLSLSPPCGRVRKMRVSLLEGMICCCSCQKSLHFPLGAVFQPQSPVSCCKFFFCTCAMVRTYVHCLK